MADTDEDHAPDGFSPLANATESELFNGPFWIRRAPEGATLGFRCKARHLNAAGVCHGGLLAVFADMLGYGLGVGDSSGATPTLALSIDFLAPVRRGDWVESRPEIARETRSMTVFQSLMRVNGETVARCNGIYKKRQPVPAAGH